MIVVMKPTATDSQIDHIVSVLAARGLDAKILRGTERPVIAVIGKVSADVREFEDLPGVAECTRISRPYKLASREWKSEQTVVKVGDYAIGGPQMIVMAGPCSVENRDQLLQAARECHRAGAHILRGGAFKPRTSPYAFQGLGEEGLKLLAEARDLYHMPVVTEIVSPTHVSILAKYTDILQVGARNMQNFELLKAVSEVDKPVLLKRGISATIEELLMAAEYILSGGNPNVILCERGIRTYETATRNTLDLSAIPVLRALTHLPIIVDPSHGTGHRVYVAPMALAAVAAGADGIMIEVHPDPPSALSDGPQSLYPKQLDHLLRDVEVIAPVVGRHLPRPEVFHPNGSEAAKVGAASRTTVAYQGQAGAFSEKATRQYFGPEVEAAPHHSFRDVFEAVQEGRVHYGVLPVENSLTGSIHENYDLLLEFDLHIVGELKLRIVHNLIALPGTARDDIKTIYAHPQAAAQCEEYLRAQAEWRVINVYDTAGSVAHVKTLGQRDAAAIAGPEAARIYGLEILQESIEDHPSNFTRFIVIGKDARVPDNANKTTLVFSTQNRPGALLDVLKTISDHQVNMVKLESRPIQGKPWEYMFYADVQNLTDGTEWRKMFEDLARHTPFLRNLGSYYSAV